VTFRLDWLTDIESARQLARRALFLFRSHHASSRSRCIEVAEENEQRHRAGEYQQSPEESSNYRFHNLPPSCTLRGIFAVNH